MKKFFWKSQQFKNALDREDQREDLLVDGRDEIRWKIWGVSQATIFPNV